MPHGPHDHLDGDRMVLLALGETIATDDERVHLGRCDVCVEDLTSTAAVVTLGRDAPRLAELPAPPPRVWQKIARSVGGTSPAPPLAPAAARRGRVAMRRRVLTAVGVALVGFALGAGMVLGVQRLDRPPVAAATVLAPQPAAPPGAAGSAQLVRVGGGRHLRVRVSGMPAPTGYYEVWLYDPSSGVMVAVGTLNSSGSADLAVPESLDSARYTVVDVSAQPLNGDPAHGTSMLRGTLH